MKKGTLAVYLLLASFPCSAMAADTTVSTEKTAVSAAQRSATKKEEGKVHKQTLKIKNKKKITQIEKEKVK